jgi:hypothetical protein
MKVAIEGLDGLLPLPNQDIGESICQVVRESRFCVGATDVDEWMRERRRRAPVRCYSVEQLQP